MTRRERMFTTLSHRQPDMIPWQIGFTIEAHAKMVDYLKDPAFTEKIGTISPASVPTGLKRWGRLYRDIFGVVGIGPGTKASGS